MNGTPFTPNFVGSLGQYPIYDYIDSKSNLNYKYTSNAQTQIDSLKQKDLSHDASISSLNTTVDGLVTTTATHTATLATQATQITTLQTAVAGNTTAIATNTGAITDLNLNKVNKSSFNSTGVIYMDVAGNVQLSYDNTAFSQYVVVTGNASVLTLNDTYKNLPTTTTTAISTASNNCYQNSSNTTYNNLYNNYYTKTDTSNVFVTSNVFQNSTGLVNYNNLNNQPWTSNLHNILTTQPILYNATSFVGIGTTIPNINLHIHGTSSAGFKMSSQYSTTTGTGGFNINMLTGSCNVSMTNQGDFSLSTGNISRLTTTKGGNTVIGSMKTPTQIFQINNGGRLRIANDNTDYSMIGTIDVDYTSNTKIQLNGNSATTNAGNVEYYATSTGNHVFYTNNTITEAMRIIYGGTVGIGITNPNSTYKLDVNGTINATEYVKSGLNISNIFTTSNVITNNYYSKANLDAIVSSQKVYTNKLYANGYNLPFEYADSFVNFSNVLCCRTNATGANYNDMNGWFGYGDPTLGVLTTFAGTLNFPSNATSFNGLKILRNGLLHLCSSNSLVISSILNNVEIYGNKIWLVGDVYTSLGTLAKKIPKYFTTSRTANFDGISCLAYDIDLTKISSKQTIDGTDFRHFRIKFFFASGRVDYQFAPRSFDVSLSTYNTLSVCSSDIWGVSSGLNKAFNSEYFLYKQNIDLLTFCCPTAIFGTTNLKVCYIIEDLVAQ